MNSKIVVAITGASGSVYAKLLIESLLRLKIQWTELAVVMSANAKQVWHLEIGDDSYRELPVKFYDKYDFNAPFASGSAQFNIMIIAPCSMGTLARIAAGFSDDLVTRSADVILKERRKLILMIRETPYNLVHIRNMETITLAGGIICPATPSFYHQPKTIEDAAITVVNRALQLAGIDTGSKGWGDENNDLN